MTQADTRELFGGLGHSCVVRHVMAFLQPLPGASVHQGRFNFNLWGRATDKHTADIIFGGAGIIHEAPYAMDLGLGNFSSTYVPHFPAYVVSSLTVP